MANTKYDIELKKRRSIVYLSLFFWSNLNPKLSQFHLHGGYHNVNEYNSRTYELLLKNNNYI